MKFAALALFLLAPQLAAAQPAVADAPDSATQAISLADAIRMAQLNSPQGVQAQGALRLARVTTRAAYLAFVPNINVNAASTWQRGQRIGQTGSLIDFTGPSKSFNDGLSFSMELFDGGQRFHDISSARAGAAAADAGEISMRFAIALQVKEQYYNVLAAREALAAANAQIEEANTQMRGSAARVQAGAAIRSDSLRSMVLLGSARLALITAETQLSNANAALTRLVGSPVPVTAADVPPDETLPTLDVAALMQLAADAPALQAARADLRSARAASKSARTPYLPTLTANFSRNGSGFDSRYGFKGTYAYSSSFRLNFSYPIFNQLQREQTAVRAYVAEDQAEANLRDAELEARQQITEAVGLLRSAEQRISVQEASVRAAEEDLSIQQQRYALNASLLVDVVQSQTQLTEARTGLIEARFDFRVARARLESLLGRDLNSLR